MKKNILLFLGLWILGGCGSYESFVNYRPVDYIPNGVKQLNATATIEQMGQAFQGKNIFYQERAGGLITDVILLDQGTRAQYQVFSQDNGQVVIKCFWGITEKVAADIAAFAGPGQAAAYSNQGLNQVVYKKGEKRPKFVFDYMANILEDNGLKFSWQ